MPILANPPRPSRLPRAADIDAISLDLDDTLWPVLPALVNAEREMHQWLLERAPATAAICSVERIREIRLLLAMAHAEQAHDMGWLRLQSLRQALEEGGDDPALAVGAFNVFLDARQRVTLYQDVEEVLARWKGRYKLLVVTNGNADIDRIGIGHYFDASAAAHELGFGKPDRRIFEYACSKVGIAPPRVLHVGDDLDLDVMGARGAGMHAAWLRRPDLQHQARRASAREDSGEGGERGESGESGEDGKGGEGGEGGVGGAAEPPPPVYSDLRAIEQALDRA